MIDGGRVFYEIAIIWTNDGYTSSGSWPGHCIADNADQIRLGPRFGLHKSWCSWCTNCKLFLWRWWEISRRWGGMSSLNLPQTNDSISSASDGILRRKWVHNHHLRISNPGGNRRMTPPKAPSNPLWALPLVCHLLVLPVQYIVYTWSWDQAFRGPDIPLQSLWTQLEQPPHKMEFALMPLTHMAQAFLPDFWCT